MLKSFLIIINLHYFLFASQVILVVADDINSTKAKLLCFEDEKLIFDAIDVNIGKNGLGLGVGKIDLPFLKNIELKKEGDKKTPIGIFNLTHIFGYENNITNSNMPYLYADENLICVDDVNHSNYNQIISMPNIKPKSFEYMKREDEQYKLGVVIEHNKDQIKGLGSCIFLHIYKDENSSTAGCTSMSYDNIKQIIDWLDLKKNPTLIQITKEYLNEIKPLVNSLP